MFQKQVLKYAKTKNPGMIFPGTLKLFVQIQNSETEN